MPSPRLRIAHWPHAPGDVAEPRVRAWIETCLGLPMPLPALPRDARGRPQLADVLPGWDVNWSHGGGRLLAVLGQGLDVGCDVEAAARRFRQASALAQRYFDAATAAAIAALPAADQADAALRQWVVREAVLKAHGQGLAFGLHRLQATWDSAGPRLVACDVALGAPEAWTLHAVDVPACLAVVALREHCA